MIAILIMVLQFVKNVIILVKNVMEIYQIIVLLAILLGIEL